MRFDLAWMPRHSRDACWNEIDGEVVVACTTKGTICGLSETAAEIWRRCDGETTVDQLLRQLQEAFDVEPATLENDVARFLESMVSQSLLMAPEVAE